MENLSLKVPKIYNNQEFLQSNVWENIVQKAGEETCRIEQALLISKKINLPLFSSLKAFPPLNYQYSPRGPILKNSLEKNEILDNFLILVNKIKQEFKPIFFRFEPELELIETLKNKALGYKVLDKYKLKKTIDLQPRQTLLVDLSLSEEDMLKAMQQKTRYNIKLAAKKGVEIIEVSMNGDSKKSFAEDASDQIDKAQNNFTSDSNFELYFSEFLTLMKKTSNRDGFKIHSEAHYKNLLISSAGKIKLFFAQYQGQKIATGLFSFYGDKVIYLHGASDNEFRNFMAPYLLQFEIIKKAKGAGFKFYDFYGIDAKKWPGVTRFKQGFGGFVYNYAGTYDLVFRPGLYLLYNFLRKLRRSF